MLTALIVCQVLDETRCVLLCTTGTCPPLGYREHRLLRDRDAWDIQDASSPWKAFKNGQFPGNHLCVHLAWSELDFCGISINIPDSCPAVPLYHHLLVPGIRHLCNARYFEKGFPRSLETALDTEQGHGDDTQQSNVSENNFFVNIQKLNGAFQ